MIGFVGPSVMNTKYLKNWQMIVVLSVFTIILARLAIWSIDVGVISGFYIFIGLIVIFLICIVYMLAVELSKRK